MDKNSISGIVLIMAMLLGYQYFFAPKEPVQVKKEVAAAKKVSPASKSNTAVAVVADSSIQVKEQLYTLENENLRVTLSNFGGKLVSVQLKNYKSYKTYTANKKDGIVLFDAQKDLFDVEIPTNGKKLALGKLVYQALESKNQVSFTSTLPNGKNIIQTYQLPAT